MAVQLGKFLTIDTSHPAIPYLASAIASSTGASDAGKIVKLNESGLIDATMLGSAPSATAGEAITSGDLVYLYNDSGTVKLAKADASAANGSKRAMAIAVTSGQSGSPVSYVTNGLATRTTHGYGAPGTQLYLSAAAPGDCASAPPSSSGYLVQAVGVVKDDNTIQFSLGMLYTV